MPKKKMRKRKKKKQKDEGELIRIQAEDFVMSMRADMYRQAIMLDKQRKVEYVR